jgi:glycosyltransferase involved in cell wall biosynthesis
MTAPTPLRIGIAVESSLWGGLETHALDLASVIAARGHHPIILCSNSHTLELFRAKTELDLALMPSFSTSGTLVLFRAFRALALDGCIFEKGTLHAASLAFDVAARLACGRYVTVQQLVPPVLPDRSSRRVLGVPSPNVWHRRMVWRAWSRSIFPNVTVCVSEAVSAALRNDYRFDSAKLLTVRNGVDVDRFRDNPAAARSIREQWHVPDSALVFGAVCRLVPEKGLDVCLEAFRRLTETTERPVRLVIVGDGPERPALEALTARLDLGDHVRFEGFRRDVPEVLAALDLLVLSSRGLEGLPLIVVEALAVGRPVIATRVAGTPEIFTREGLGWLVTPDDPSGLADAMRHAAAEPPERIQAMRAASRQQAVERFDASKEYGRIASLIDGRHQ